MNLVALVCLFIAAKSIMVEPFTLSDCLNLLDKDKNSKENFIVKEK